MLYAIILDFADYWRHCLSHQFRWWWALHSLHHAQRQMTFWSDDRNHLLDDLIAFVWFGVDRAADRRAAVAVPAAGAGAAVPEIAVARQRAAVVRLAGRPAAGLAAVPSGASRRAARRADEAATTARCCRGGTCCSAQRISPATMSGPAIRPARRHWPPAPIGSSNGRGCDGSCALSDAHTPGTACDPTAEELTLPSLRRVGVASGARNKA